MIRAAAFVGATALVWALPQNAVPMTNSVFYGITVHVSTNNIKVQNPKTKETLSFLILPKFDQVFSANGKTTYQMSAIKAGQYVAVLYDQKALGARHANKIYLMNNAEQRIGTQ
jgi:hypothetical protein